jgi:hypothetical protein
MSTEAQIHKECMCETWAHRSDKGGLCIYFHIILRSDWLVVPPVVKSEMEILPVI